MDTLLKTNGITPFADHKLPHVLEQAKALQPLMQEKAIEAEKRRSPTAEVERALRAMNAFSLILPERLGGGGLSLSAFSRVQMEFAKGDPSMAWVVQIINGTSWTASLTADPLQDALFGDGPKAVCASAVPPGKARKAKGGFIVNGAWSYASGSRQADWAQCGIFFEGEGAPVVPGMSLAYIPMSQLEIKDTWYVTGMQGTGSDTIVATDVLVPDHMIVTMDKPLGMIVPGKRHFGAASDWLIMVPTVRAVGLALLVGAARQMQALCEADSKKKPIVSTTFKTRTESAVAMHELGRVAAHLDSAETLLFDMLGQLDALALQGVKPSLEVCSRQRAQCAHVIQLIHGVIEQIMFMSGSSAFALGNPLQRYWRDIHMAMRHALNIPTIGYEIYGRDNLGALPNIAPPGAY